MGNIELIIKIPEDEYEEIIGSEDCGLHTLTRAIAKGTVLPKRHGRILDEKDILDTKNNDGGWYDLVDMPEYIAGVKAIIEADKERGLRNESKSDNI